MYLIINVNLESGGIFAHCLLIKSQHMQMLLLTFSGQILPTHSPSGINKTMPVFVVLDFDCSLNYWTFVMFLNFRWHTRKNGWRKLLWRVMWVICRIHRNISCLVINKLCKGSARTMKKKFLFLCGQYFILYYLPYLWRPVPFAWKISRTK